MRGRAETNRLLTSGHAYRGMASAVSPYGDGHAAARAVAGIEHLLGLAARPAPYQPGTAAGPADDAA